MCRIIGSGFASEVCYNAVPLTVAPDTIQYWGWIAFFESILVRGWCYFGARMVDKEGTDEPKYITTR